MRATTKGYNQVVPEIIALLRKSDRDKAGDAIESYLTADAEGTMRKKLALSVVAMVLAAMTAVGADPTYRTNRYCLKTDSSDRWKPSRHRIKVLLHESLLDICGRHPASCQSADLDTQRFNIERALRTALADFHNAGGANLRFDFRGWTRSARLRDDTIVIAHQKAASPEPCPVDEPARAGHQRQPWYLGGDDRGIIFFCTQMIDGQRVIWIPWDETFTGPERLAAFIPTVKHEILHILGLSHSTTCTPSLDEDAKNASVMRENNFTFMHLAREDVRFLRDHFGPRKNDGRLFGSTDGLTWLPAASPPSGAAQSLGRPAATNSREGDNLYIAWRDSSENSISISRVTPGGSWSVRSTIQSLDAPYFPGLAHTSNTNLIVAYQTHRPLLSSGQLLTAVRASQDGAETWTSEFALPLHADVPGAAATHDPATDTWLILSAFRKVPAGGWRISYMSLGAGHEPSDLGESLASADVPSMACAPREETDPFNCLLAWQSDRWTGGIDWTQCRVLVGETGARLDCQPTEHHGFVSVSGAPVTFGGTQAGFPWQLALSQGGSVIYTWRKAAGPEAEWVDERSLVFSPEAGIPAVGSRAGGSGRRFLATLSKR